MDDWFYFTAERPHNRKIKDGKDSAPTKKGKNKANKNEDHDKREVVPKRQPGPTP